MRSTPQVWKGRCKQVGGRLCKLWGRWTNDSRREFVGDLIIVEGKLEAFHAARRRQSSQTGAVFGERRRPLNIVN